ncbi:hypothetical protein [Chroococcidiopsis sp.]
MTSDQLSGRQGGLGRAGTKFFEHPPTLPTPHTLHPTPHSSLVTVG